MTLQECIEYLEDKLDHACQTDNQVEQFSINQCITLLRELQILRKAML
jgi:hypothetical protein